MAYPGTPALTEFLPKPTAHSVFVNKNIKKCNVRKAAYNTLVCSQLEYGGPHPHTKRKLLQLEKVQRRATRWTTDKNDYGSSVTAMLQVGGLLSKDGQTRVIACSTKLCKALWQYHSQIVSPTFEFQYFIQRLNSNSRYCHPMTLRLIHTARDSYKYSFYQFAIVQWNALSQNIVYQTLIHSRLQWVECSIQVPRSRVSCF